MFNHYPIKKEVPEIGDIIYVPSVRAEEESSDAWHRNKKKGGYATVGFIQQFDENNHLVFVTEYGRFGMWWEKDIGPQQKELAKEYGFDVRAQVLLR